MKSAYPSSQSFFNASSDSISAIDVEKCRTSSSFTSLSDLFGRNPNGKSDLFSNVRTPVFVPAEVTFPTRKNRECEDRVAEKVSLWHEWGSGECPGEESSGLLTDMFKSSSSELFSASSSNLFPNLGSANVNMVPEEFTFPERRKREDESWRERRGFRQDWVPSVDNNVGEGTATTRSVVDFIPKKSVNPSNFLSSSKSSLFPNVVTPVGSQPEFPARKKRTENPFWKDYSSCTDAMLSECTTSGSSTSGVNSLSGLYSKSPSSKCSSLFSNLGTTNVTSEEVVFPSRKKNPDRNAWRDWCNTGYSDWALLDEAEDEAARKEEQERENLQSLARPLQSAATKKGKMVNSGIVPESSTYNSVHTDLEAAQFTGVYASRNSSGSSAYGPRLAGNEDGECQEADSASINTRGQARNADRTSVSGNRIGRSETSKQKKLVSKDVYEEEDNVHVEEGYRSGRRDFQEPRVSRQKVHSFPPPLGILGRQGSLRVPHHVPWVQLQPVRSEGRFMLQEVKVTQPVVFEPIREQGRLVLQLIRHEDASEHSQRDAHSCQFADGDSKTTVIEEVIAGHAVKSLECEYELEHASCSNDEPDAVDRELVMEKIKKANKSPKIHPENCLPPLNEVSQTIPKSVVKVVLSTTPSDQRIGGPQEPMKDRKASALPNDTEDGSSGNCRASLPDPGRQGRYVIHNPSPFTSEEAADGGGNQEVHALFRREAETPSQRLQFRNLSAMKLRDSDSQSSHRSAPHKCNPRNTMSTEGGSPFPSALHRSRSFRNTPLSDFGRAEGEKEECSKDRWRGREGEGFEPRPPFVSSVQGFDGSYGSQSTSSLRHWSLMKRPEAPGDPDGRLTNYSKVGASFLCADGVGKRHHEKSFWEQPCVS